MKSILKYLLKITIWVLFTVLCTLPAALCLAQDVKVSAKADASLIRIGEQTKLHLRVEAPVNAKVKFPLIPDTITKIEILNRGKIDTVKSADAKQMIYEQTLTITAFDSGYYPIPPFVFQYAHNGKEDSAFTEAMLFTVNTVPVDTTQAIKEIKAPLDISFSFKEALPYILIGLAIALLVAGLVYYMRKRKAKQPGAPRVFVPKRPAHEIALEELRKLEAEKLWQSGYYKKYHSGVSDIIRAYIEHRFGIKAMEATTDETLDALKAVKIEPFAKEKLQYLLQTADFVKFAKAQPIASENELCMQNAYAFVEMTKPQLIPVAEKKEEVVTS